MEYPRLYYEELPGKIRVVTAQIFDDIAAVSEKEVALAQSRLTESVVKQAESLSLKRHIHTWLVWGTATLFCCSFMEPSCCGLAFALEPEGFRFTARYGCR